MTTRIQRRLEALYGLERRKDKLGLDGTRALLRALGDPQDRFRSVHVAGTNGKGSVCALVERVLREAGHRTGLYTSPHLVDFRERIRVNGRWVDEDWLENALDRIEALPEGRDRTFFEVATALGFLYFAEQGVEIAVVEVGLGGRLDCTNVITPEVSVITPISIDHAEILGRTIEEIAAEKAGIIKPGVPVVVQSDPGGSGAPAGPAGSVIARKAAEMEAPLRGGWPARYDLIPIPEQMSGGYQFSNMVMAINALRVLAEKGWAVPNGALEKGVRQARWPGRFGVAPRERRLWWDGAHNPTAMQTLADAWQMHGMPAPRAVVLALSRDKPLEEMLPALERLAGGNLSVVATRTRNPRAMDPGAIAAAVVARGGSASQAADVAAACRLALEPSGPEAPLFLTGPDGREMYSVPNGPVLLTGSLFAVGEAMEVFGGAPGEQL